MKNNRERVLAALLSCPTEKEAADRARVSEKTVRNYLADESFKAEYAARRRALVDGAAGMLQKGMIEAVATISDVMRNASKPLERVAASKVILDYGIRYTEISDLYDRVETAIKLMGGE